MNYHIIYWIVIAVLACAVSQYRKKAGEQWIKTGEWKRAYDEAKDKWAAQSDALRKKGIECDQLEKENKRLEKKYFEVCKLIG